MLVLSIFPGIDLLGRAFELEGFCVVRGPDLLWGSDIRNFHSPPWVFDGIIAGPPCQDFSKGNIYRRNNLTYGQEMLKETQRVIGEALPDWFLVENVIGVPDITVSGYKVNRVKLNARWVGNAQNRMRIFQFGSEHGEIVIPEISLFENPEYSTTVVASEVAKGYRPKGFRSPYVPARPWPKLCHLMGLPETFDLPGFTKSAKGRAIGEGVPIEMGRAWARAIMETYKFAIPASER